MSIQEYNIWILNVGRLLQKGFHFCFVSSSYPCLGHRGSKSRHSSPSTPPRGHRGILKPVDWVSWAYLGFVLTDRHVWDILLGRWPGRSSARCLNPECSVCITTDTGLIISCLWPFNVFAPWLFCYFSVESRFLGVLQLPPTGQKHTLRSTGSF